MKKVFRKRTDHLRVTVTNEDKIWLPTENGGKREVGTYEQTTIQKIPMSEVPSLHEYVKEEREKALAQKEAIEQQLNDLNAIDENLSDEFVNKSVEAIKLVLEKENFKKEDGSFDEESHKNAMRELIHVSNFIRDTQKKKMLVQQLSHINEQIERGEKELKDLEEAIN